MEKKTRKIIISVILFMAFILGMNNEGSRCDLNVDKIYAKATQFINVCEGEEFEATNSKKFFKLDKAGFVTFMQNETEKSYGYVYTVKNDGTKIKCLGLRSSIRLPAGLYMFENYTGCWMLSRIVYECNSDEEVEVNDLFDDATEIECNKTYKGSFDYGWEDVDYFHFNLTQAGVIDVQYVENRKEGYEDLNTVIEIYSEDSDHNVTLLSNKENALNRQRVPAGSYFIKMEGKEYVTEAYSIQVSYKQESADAYEQEANNSIEEANNIVIGNSYTGNISKMYDYDYYHFTLDKKKKIKYKISLPINCGEKTFAFEIFKKDGAFKYEELLGSKSEDLTKAMVLDEGEYYVLFRAGYESFSNQDYSFSITIGSMIEELVICSELNDGEEIHVGDKFNLYGMVKPDECNEKLELIWTSNNKKIATISKKGEVVCKAVGKVILTATTIDGSEITVSKEIKVLDALSDVNTLSKINYTKGSLSPRFSKTKKTYTLNLNRNTAKTRLRFYLSDSKSSITVNGKDVSNYVVKIGMGQTKNIVVDVTSESGKEMVYKIKVVRRK